MPGKRHLQNLFKPGHQLWRNRLKTTAATQVPDYSNDDQPGQPSTSHVQDVTAGVGVVSPDSSGQPYDLRSKSKTGTQENPVTGKLGSMRVIHIEKNANMWNSAYQGHIELGTCARPHFDVGDERKIGLVVQQKLKCANCDFVTPFHALYDERDTAKRGRKAAVTNVALCAGMMETAIGAKGLQMLLASMDIVPPARTSINKLARKVGGEIEELSKKDMQKKAKEVAGRKRKLKNVSMDACYNSVTRFNNKKPGQAASQAIATAIETDSTNKYIVGVAVQNQLCWRGAFLRNKGFEVECGTANAHFDCAANHPESDALCERRLGRELGRQLAVDQDILVDYATSDGDARTVEGFEEAMKLVQPNWTVPRLADPRHLGQTQFSVGHKAQLSSSLFPHHTTQADKRKAQIILAADLKNRSQCIFDHVHRECQGEASKMKKVLPKVVETVLNCYAGDCSDCKNFSGGTCHGSDGKSWWEKSYDLSVSGIHSLNVNSSDRCVMKTVLDMKLGERAVEKLFLKTDTQKNEAFNRSVRVSLPKNINFSRQVGPRLHTSALRINNGPGKAVEMKAAHLRTPVSSGTRSFLARLQSQDQYQKAYNKDVSVKARRRQQRSAKKHRHLIKSGYLKHQLDLPRHDHAYPSSR
ncbi:hypothetical protein BaRGS_00020618 [Batillaria attramentaria]|uniref:Mutator-like transposase domain-containing protein n=1 Tax=Batillaria attramentaria TaxID=370345 RepID=A0ABD0KM57_9CAEN